MGTPYQQLQELEARNIAAMRQRQAPMAAGMPSLTERMAQLPQAPLKTSALNVGDRFRYGFADDWGKRQILMQAGYHPDNIKTLPNGEYGVRTEKGIKAVDPKGFQMSDIGGDIAESVGKIIPTAGTILGAKVSGGLAAGIGAAGGELARQTIGESMGVRKEGISLGDLGEIAAEGVISGLTVGAGRMLGSKLARAGATKTAATATPTTDTVIKPTTLDAMNNLVGLPRGKSKTPIKLLLDGTIDAVPEGGAAYDTIRRAGDKMINLVSQGKNISNQIYAKGLADAGINPATQKVAVGNGIKEINRSLALLKKSPLKSETQPIVRQLTELKGFVQKNAQGGQLTLEQLQGVTSALQSIKEQSFQGGIASKFTQSANRPLAAFTSAKNSIPEIAALNKQYAPQLRAIKQIQKIGKMQLDSGEFIDGGRTPEALIKRLGMEQQSRNFDALIKASQTLEKVPEFKELGFTKDLAGGLLSDMLDSASKVPFTGGRLSPSGAAQTIGKAVLPPIRRAQILKGMLKTGALSDDVLRQPISKWMPQTSAIMNIIGSGQTGADMTTPVKTAALKTLKGLTSEQARTIAVQTSARQSLNQILFGE
jgi:hypothetical protein